MLLKGAVKWVRINDIQDYALSGLSSKHEDKNNEQACKDHPVSFRLPGPAVYRLT